MSTATPDLLFTPEARRALALRSSLGGRPDLLVCFSHLGWDFVFQRPHHLMTRAARDRVVIYVEEPNYDDIERATLEVRTSGNVLVAAPQIPHSAAWNACDIQRAMVTRLLDQIETGSSLGRRIFWFYTPMALDYAAGLPCDLCIYDCMDELSLFMGAPSQLIEFERQLFGWADLVFTGGPSLFERKRPHHPRVHLFPSSIDREHFAAARNRASSEPRDQTGIPAPRVGFFGVIDERMDLAFVADLADGAPDLHLVMIGPIVKIDLEALPRRPNIHWLGSKSYAELPRYMAGWDLGFMPFALNDSTRFICPTKTPEFLSAGLQVISTRIADVMRPYGERGLVRCVGSASEAIAAARELLNANREQHQRKAERFLAGTSWDRTWAEMDHLIALQLGSPARRERAHAEAFALGAASV